MHPVQTKVMGRYSCHVGFRKVPLVRLNFEQWLYWVSIAGSRPRSVLQNITHPSQQSQIKAKLCWAHKYQIWLGLISALFLPQHFAHVHPGLPWPGWVCLQLWPDDYHRSLGLASFISFPTTRRGLTPFWTVGSTTPHTAWTKKPITSQDLHLYSFCIHTVYSTQRCDLPSLRHIF